MADSMLDFSKVANLALGIGHLEQQAESNRLQGERNAFMEAHYEDQADLQRSAQKLDAQRLKQTSAFRGFDELEKIKNHPTLATNRGKQIDLLLAQGTLLEQGLGVKVPMPDRDELMGGYDSMDRFVKTMRNGTDEEKFAATTDMLASNPVYASKVFDDMKKAGDVSTHMEEMQMKIEANKAKLQSLNLKNAKANLQQNFFTQHVASLGGVTQLATDPRYAEHLRKVQSFESDKAKQIYLGMHPDFKEQFEASLKQASGPIDEIAGQLKDNIDARYTAIHAAQAKDGEAPLELVDETSGYESVYAARQAQAAFLADPYNKQNWKNLKAAEQNVRILQGKAGKQISEIADARTALMETKFDAKQQSGLAESMLEESFINNLNGGDDDNQSLGKAIKAVKQKYPGVPFDATKILNPNKKGKSEIALKMPSDIVGQNLKAIDAAQSTIDFTDEIMDRITSNPSIVGKGAKISAAFAGAGQQLRALAGMDPGASRFLNTKTRDDAEAYQELLVYMQAKSMDPSGALDIKVVQHARDVVGDMSGWATGPEQVMNKLRLVKENAGRNLRRARGHIRGGIGSYLEDQPKDAAPKKAVGEMNLQETMQELLQSIGGEK